jgi:hypothetical protein
MPSRRPLKVPTQEFLEGAPVQPAEPKPKRVAKPKPAPIAEAPAQLDLTLTDVEIEPTKLVSLKIPLKMFEDIDTLRRNSRITLTDIFIKSAAPQVSRLIEQLNKRKAQR